MVHNKMIRA